MKKTVFITGAVAALALFALFAFVNHSSDKNKVESEFGVAMRGNFEINISSTGELIPENAIDIKGPDIVQNRNFRASAIKILDLIPEGTEVGKGDYIATLDRTAFDNRLKDEMDAMKTIEANLNLVILDSAVTLSELRDEITDQFYNVKEATLTVDHSTYEPPSVQRMAKLELDISKRQLDQLKNNYRLKYAQTLENIKVQELLLSTQLRVVNDLKNVLKGFTVTAPSHGIIIYKKDIFGKKIVEGTMLNPFNPIVASLYDLSSMLSKIYVSEVEINKVRTGQSVDISIDAIPGKTYTGKVATIANIGQQLPNSDSKEYEVEVKLSGADPALKPSLTTNNTIIVKNYSNVVYVPLESVHAGPDSIPFVYTRAGTKQVVIPGESNDKNIIIEQGLSDGTSIWLNTPGNAFKFKLTGKDLIAVIKEREHTIKLASEGGEKDKLAISNPNPLSQNTKPTSGLGSFQAVTGSY